MSVAVRELAELPPPQLAPEAQPYLDGDALGRWPAQQPQRIRKILTDDFTVFVEAHADTA